MASDLINQMSDVDLDIQRWVSYALGIASPQDGGIQSIQRLMPEWTEEEMVGEELESWDNVLS